MVTTVTNTTPSSDGWFHVGVCSQLWGTGHSTQALPQHHLQVRIAQLKTLFQNRNIVKLCSKGKEHVFKRGVKFL